MNKPAIQLNRFDRTLDPLPDILKTVNDVGFTGVEFCFRFPEVDPEPIARTLKRTGLEVAGAHVWPGWFEDDWESRLDSYRQIGCERLVGSHFDEWPLKDEATVEELAFELESVADLVDDWGFDFYYHNKGRGGTELESGQLALIELLSTLDDTVGFQLDVGHAIEIGADPVALLERYEDRIDTIHFRDAVPAVDHSIALGQGEADLEAVYAAAVQADVEWIIYEGNPRLDTLEGGLEWARGDRVSHVLDGTQ